MREALSDVELRARIRSRAQEGIARHQTRPHPAPLDVGPITKSAPAPADTRPEA